MFGDIYVLGVNHTCAGLELREKLTLNCGPFAFGSSGALCNKSDELVLLSTCNRVELTAYSTDKSMPDRIIEVWARNCGQPETLIRQNIYIKKKCEAVEHVFKVASSLDSMIIGESQILGQLKAAFKLAVHEGTSKAILNKLFHRAFFTAKEIRTKTKIGHAPVSVSHAAVDAAKQILGTFSGKRVLLVGAGEMARQAARHLKNQGCSNFIYANRTKANALQLAEELGGEVISLSSLSAALPSVDLLICSSSAPDYLVSTKSFASPLRRKILCIDISMPRNIDPEVKTLANASLMDLDDIQLEIDKNKQKRFAETEKALSIVEREAGRFMDWTKSLSLKPTITDLFAHTQKIAEGELKKTLRKIGPVDAETEEALRAMMGSVLKKINHRPINFIKSLQKQHGDVSRQISLLRSFFNLDGES